MAPKLADIRSESWLDLSLSQPIERPKWMPRRLASEQPELLHQDQSSSSVQLTSSSRSDLEERQNTQDHLLIRWRQRSFELNRRSSSASLASSSLVNSIPISNFIQTDKSKNEDGEEANKKPQKSIQFISRRLERFKLKLEERSKRKKRTDQFEFTASDRLKNPLARSLSSLSGRLGDRLGNLRRSWSKFLVNYGEQIKLDEPLDDINSVGHNWRSHEPVDKRQLTERWLANYHLFDR